MRRATKVISWIALLEQGAKSHCRSEYGCNLRFKITGHLRLRRKFIGRQNLHLDLAVNSGIHAISL